jgi:RHS repeat-associated protein
VSDGRAIIAEYDGSNVLQKRYAFDGNGQPLVQYDAAGNRTWMLGDERGSIIALANDTAAMTAINTYDEYGIPAAANQGTFQYAGMLWLPRPNLYAPTFRAFNAGQGRFNQTDPIGYRGGPNSYVYVLGDPVNFIDPLGLDLKLPNGVPQCQEAAGCPQDIIVTGPRDHSTETPESNSQIENSQIIAQIAQNSVTVPLPAATRSATPDEIRRAKQQSGKKPNPQSDQTTLKYVLECGGSVVVFIGAAATSETGVGVAIAAGTGAVAIGVCI